jgi:hypothetical protein
MSSGDIPSDVMLLIGKKISCGTSNYREMRNSELADQSKVPKLFSIVSDNV